MPSEYFFWFAQPSSILNSYDRWAFYFFAAMVVLSIVTWMVRKFAVKHPVTKKLLDRYHSALFWFGAVGLVWFAFRYESVPIFSRRVFAGSIIVAGLVWVGFVKYYLLFKFRKEKQEYDAQLLKNKYIK